MIMYDAIIVRNYVCHLAINLLAIYCLMVMYSIAIKQVLIYLIKPPNEVVREPLIRVLVNDHCKNHPSDH